MDENAPPPEVVGAIERHFAGRESIRMLDAGCGACCRLRLAVPAYTVGIDVSPHQIARNPDLDEAIVGELERVEIEPDAFDVVVCWNVLEHLHDPIAAVDRLTEALRVGGLLLLGWPNPRSAKARAARLLPHAAHVRLFRALYPGVSDGKDSGPFETVLDPSLDPSGIVDHLERRGLSLRMLISYESAMQRKARGHLRVTGWRWAAAKRVIATLSAGRVDPEQTDLIGLFARD
jgi:SAM-dependent methyltransferase